MATEVMTSGTVTHNPWFEGPRGAPLCPLRTSCLLFYLVLSCHDMAMEEVPSKVTLCLQLLGAITFGTAQDTKHRETLKGWVQHALRRQALVPV